MINAETLADLRTYARGYVYGETTATRDEAVAYRREALVLMALRELGVSPGASREILVQALHDVYCTTPGCSERTARILAAEMVIAILQVRLAERAPEASAEAAE